MSKFAQGKFAYATSDRSGVRYKYKDMRREWNGLLVGKDEYEPKHPQLGPFRSPVDAQALKDARPARTEPAVEVLLAQNSLSAVSGSSVVTIREPGHGRSTGDTIRIRNINGFNGFTKTVLEDAGGYEITVVTTETYTIDLTDAGETASSSGRGGGDNASVGPITVEA
jgi:hypothetical protein